MARDSLFLSFGKCIPLHLFFFLSLTWHHLDLFVFFFFPVFVLISSYVAKSVLGGWISGVVVLD